MKSVCLIIVFLFPYITFAQTTYFVNDLAGHDTNRGTSMNAAFRSIEKINQISLLPGDSILFRCGGVWIGNLFPRGSGTKNKRIVIGAYGKGPIPVLDARGIVAEGEQVSHTVRLFNQEYIEFRDLKIKNFKPLEKPVQVNSGGIVSYANSPKTGIYVEGKDCGTLRDIYFINLEICDVNGSMNTKNNGGIYIEITRDKDEKKWVKSNFDGLYTEGCYIHHIDRTGWSNSSEWDNRTLRSKWGDPVSGNILHDWYLSENVVLRNNKFEGAGANALIVRVSQSPLVEHCLFTHNGSKSSGNTSFPYNCDNAMFQFNKACYTVYNSEADSWNNKEDADAGGFDSDYKCKNTTIQYNYSHHNGHGGILICCMGNNQAAFNDGTIVRYNIFEDNQHHVIRTSGPVTNTQIYNNVIFSGSEIDSVMLLYHKSWGGYSDSTAYLNNIFYSEGKGNFIGLGKSTRNIFQSNTFYGKIMNEPSDPLKSKLNPHFIGANSSESNWKSFLRFMLQNDSPEIDKGIEIKGDPGKDFSGNPIHGIPDRNAFETKKH